MIFVTVGNATQHFSRLIDAMIALSVSGAFGDEQVMIQHGYTPAPSRWPESVIDFMTNDAFEDHIRRANVIVTHAGCGTLMSCIRAGKVPVVVPRRRAWGEHVNDHQIQLANELADQQRVIVCDDLSQLGKAISNARDRRQAQTQAPSKLADLVRDAVRSLIEKRRGIPAS